jgi:hypothetical protein
MPLRVAFLLLAALFLFLGGTAAYAQQKYALVIGNGAYTGITALRNPENDAADMKTALEELGWNVGLVRNGSLDQMEGAVGRLKNRLSVNRESYGFFFYAGHGVQSNGENYLIPVDASIQSENLLRQRAMSMQFMLDELNSAGNELNSVVLDACRDNPFGWSRSGSRGLQVVTGQPADSIIVYATSAGSVAQDGTGRNGLFTTHLLNNLKTPGLSVQELFNKTGADVRRASGGSQIPAIYSQFFETAWLGGRPAVAVQPVPAPSPQPAPRPSPAPVQPAAPPVRPAPVDVYIAGNEAYEACYWRNGVKTVLSNMNPTAATSIIVSGSDMYVAGYEINAAGKTVVCYWKNGVKTVLSGASLFNGARAIALVPR